MDKKELMDYIEKLADNVESEANGYIEVMRQMYNVTDDEILRIIDVSRQICDMITTKINCKKEEA